MFQETSQSVQIILAHRSSPKTAWLLQTILTIFRLGELKGEKTKPKTRPLEAQTRPKEVQTHARDQVVSLNKQNQ